MCNLQAVALGLTQVVVLQPMPPHQPILGHIALSARILGRLPKDAHGRYLADQIHRLYPDLGGAFYLVT